MCSSSFQVFDKAVSQQLSAVLDKWKGKTHWHMFYFIIFFQQYQETFITTFFDDLGKVSRKKIAVLLDFVQMMEREGPAQIFCPLCICIFGQ